MKELLILRISVAILSFVAGMQLGYIVGKWEKFDYDGKLAIHTTQIELLRSDVKVVKDKLHLK